MAKRIKQKKLNTEEDKALAAAEKEREAAGIQDDFQARGFELVEWMQDHSNVVLGILGSIVLAGMVYALFALSTERGNESASMELRQALEIYQAPVGEESSFITTGTVAKKDGLRYADTKERAAAASKVLQKLVMEHGDSGVGLMARLYLGNTSLQLEAWDDAVTAYDGFLKKAPKNDILRFAGLDGLATALEAKGDTAGAIARLEEMAGLPGKVNEDAALLKLGRLYKAAGQTSKARASLERLAQDFADSPLKRNAEDLLGSLPAKE